MTTLTFVLTEPNLILNSPDRFTGADEYLYSFTANANLLRQPIVSTLDVELEGEKYDGYELPYYFSFREPDPDDVELLSDHLAYCLGRYKEVNSRDAPNLNCQVFGHLHIYSSEMGPFVQGDILIEEKGLVAEIFERASAHSARLTIQTPYELALGLSQPGEDSSYLTWYSDELASALVTGFWFKFGEIQDDDN